jgi:aspartate/methionine/tyrosine aminotransferase
VQTSRKSPGTRRELLSRADPSPSRDADPQGSLPVLTRISPHRPLQQQPVSPHPTPLFPYMSWAQNESWISAYSLSQSGLPAPDASFLEGLGIDLAQAPAGARQALTERLGELFCVAPERVLVTVGASAAMHIVAARWFRAPARVAVETPSYEALRSLPGLFGAESRPLVRDFAEGWKPDPAAARETFAGHNGPGHIFLTNPHNPTGAKLGEAEIVALAAEAERAGGLLISGEAYGEFLPNEERVHAFALAPNTLSIGTLTKAYGLGALRIGWMILGEGVSHEYAALQDLAFMTYVDAPTVSLRAGLVALNSLPLLLGPLRRVEAESRPTWERWLRETEGVEALVPERGIIAFPRIAGLEDGRALVRFLQSEHSVDVVPGEFFGAPGFLRVGCGVPAETLKEGLARLTEGLAAWRTRA